MELKPSVQCLKRIDLYFARGVRPGGLLIGSREPIGESVGSDISLRSSSASESPRGGHPPDSNPRAGQKPLSSTMTASNCHMAWGSRDLSNSTVPCKQAIRQLTI